MLALISGFMVLALILGGFSYFVTESLQIAIIIASVFFLYLNGYAVPTINKSRQLLNKTNQGYAFINQFIITLSVHQTINATYQQLYPKWPNEVKKYIENEGKLDSFDNLLGLGDYFNSYIYRVFLDILKIYAEEGGSIIKMSEYLLAQVRLGEEQLSELKQIILKKIGELITLWALSLFTLVFTKISIDDIYHHMLTNQIFLLFMISYFLIVLINLHLFFKRFYLLSKEVNNNDV